MRERKICMESEESAEDIHRNASERAQIKKYDEYSCDICQGNGVDQSIRLAFRVNYCMVCKSSLELITQSTAINSYLLGKEDLKRLRKMEKVNPRNEGWKPMLLYLKKDVEEASKSKHQDLEKEKQKRAEKKKERKQKILKKKLSLLKRNLRPRIKIETEHRHDFDGEGQCACGMAVEQEEI